MVPTSLDFKIHMEESKILDPTQNLTNLKHFLGF